MKFFTSTFTTPKTPAPWLSVSVAVNVWAVPEAAVPCAGDRLTTAIVPEAVNGTCHVPIACHPELPPSRSRAARYTTLLPVNQALPHEL